MFTPLLAPLLLGVLPSHGLVPRARYGLAPRTRCGPGIHAHQGDGAAEAEGGLAPVRSSLPIAPNTSGSMRSETHVKFFLNEVARFAAERARRLPRLLRSQPALLIKDFARGHTGDKDRAPLALRSLPPPGQLLARRPSPPRLVVQDSGLCRATSPGQNQVGEARAPRFLAFSAIAVTPELPLGSGQLRQPPGEELPLDEPDSPSLQGSPRLRPARPAPRGHKSERGPPQWVALVCA